MRAEADFPKVIPLQTRETALHSPSLQVRVFNEEDLPLKTQYGLLEGDHSSLRPLTSYMRKAERLVHLLCNLAQN